MIPYNQKINLDYTIKMTLGLDKFGFDSGDQELIEKLLSIERSNELTGEKEPSVGIYPGVCNCCNEPADIRVTGPAVLGKDQRSMWAKKASEEYAQELSNQFYGECTRDECRSSSLYNLDRENIPDQLKSKIIDIRDS